MPLGEESGACLLSQRVVGHNGARIRHLERIEALDGQASPARAPLAFGALVGHP
jgi:hypothetical protein